jgi:hypothetical protein
LTRDDRMGTDALGWSAAWPMLGAIAAALVAAVGTYLAVVHTQRETAEREFALTLWRMSADAYIELVNWTAWIEHWYIAGSPDPNERPLTVTMARTAARITAFGDTETGDEAFDLLTKLRPYVSHQNISGKPPPPEDVRHLAEVLAARAQHELRRPLNKRSGRASAGGATPRRLPERYGEERQSTHRGS